MSKFYITAIRYAPNKSHISHLLAHSPDSEGGRLKKGVIMSKSEIVALMQQKHTFTTAVFNYSSGKWSEGSDISIVIINDVKYLRTDPDKTAKDNLAHLLLIDELR